MTRTDKTKKNNLKDTDENKKGEHTQNAEKDSEMTDGLISSAEKRKRIIKIGGIIAAVIICLIGLSILIWKLAF